LHISLALYYNQSGALGRYTSKIKPSQIDDFNATIMHILCRWTINQVTFGSIWITSQFIQLKWFWLFTENVCDDNIIKFIFGYR